MEVETAYGIRDERPLTAKQMRFAEEYIKDPSSMKQAAMRAGYSIHSAEMGVSRLMSDPRIQKIIRDAQDQAAKKLGITAEKVMQELWAVAGANPGDVITINSEGETDVDPTKIVGEVSITTVTGGNRPKVKSVTSKTVKPADKIAALNTLAKLLNMFPKQEIELKTEFSFADAVLASIPTPEIIDTTATEVQPEETA